MSRSPVEGPDNFYLVGKILSAHGVRGDVTVQVWTDRPDRFDVGCYLWLLSDEGNSRLTVRNVRKGPRGLIIRFESIDTRDQAEQLAGIILAISAIDRGEPEEDAHYVSDLLDCMVVTDDGDNLGRIVDVMSQPHHDLYVVEGPYGEILVPVVREFIQDIDIEQRRVVVRQLEAFWDGTRS